MLFGALNWHGHFFLVQLELSGVYSKQRECYDSWCQNLFSICKSEMLSQDRTNVIDVHVYTHNTIFKYMLVCYHSCVKLGFEVVFRLASSYKRFEIWDLAYITEDWLNFFRNLPWFGVIFSVILLVWWRAYLTDRHLNAWLEYLATHRVSC